MEIWKPINGYEESYLISNKGKVKSLLTNKILKPSLNTYRYPSVALTKNKKAKSFCIHLLVARTFIENFENKPQVNHIDGNKENNNVDNLEWVTCQENIKHAYKNNLMKRPIGKLNSRFGKYGRDHNRSKAVNKYDLNNKFICQYGGIAEAHRRTGISEGNIGMCCRNKRKQAGGYIWKFAQENEKNEVI